MYRILVKQHCEDVTPFSSGYDLVDCNGAFDIFNLGEFETIENAIEYFPTILKKIDAIYDEKTDSYLVYGDRVYCDGDTECIVCGMLFYIDCYVTKKRFETKWINLKSPKHKLFDIRVSSSEDVINVTDEKNDYYLMNLDSFDLCELVDEKLYGRKVFWLDPNSWEDDKENNSGWVTIKSIDGSIIHFDNNTKGYITECYI